MYENDKRRYEYRDIAVSLALLTRLPIPLKGENFTRGARAAWAYPLVGVVMGFTLATLSGFLLWLGLESGTVALVILATSVVLTGAMHEDGLADCADGFWGGWEKDRRLEIMKDSQIGSYGVIALVLSLAARWWALSLLLDQGAYAALIAVPVVSRAAMPVVMAALPHARANGLSHAQGRPDATVAASAAGIAFVIAVLMLDWSAFMIAILTALTIAAVIAIARAKIGGQTGDVLGATQQLVEVVLLIALFG